MKKFKIVVVENDPDERFFMEEGFVKTNLFEVLAMLENGETLFEWLNNNTGPKPELILSDLNMQGMNGYDVIEQIKQHKDYSEIPVIITSTSSTPSIIEKCLNLGAFHYMVKPDSFIDYEPFINELHKIFKEKKSIAG